MNFIFISPYFPYIYYQFCERLLQNGVNVLGIGDAPYQQLPQECRAAMREYYKVDTLEDYDQVMRAVAFFTFRYGKIDWLESNNEYWLENDAQLRTDFHIETGIMMDGVNAYKHKSNMKEFYEKAQIPCARWHMVSTLKEDLEFIKQVGYPVVVKPDCGVGAYATFKITEQAELEDFYANLPDVPYIMEEYIHGMIVSYDGIVDQDGHVMFDTSHIFPEPIMDVVNEGNHLSYYTDRMPAADVVAIGQRTLNAFQVKGRFFHLEFFRLLADKEGMGKKGDLAALEVNMRPPGGYTPEMMNYASAVDVYQIYADMVSQNHTDIVSERPYYCAYASRRDGKRYRKTHEEIMSVYGEVLVMQERMPDALSGAMGNDSYVARFETEKEVYQFIEFVQQLQPAGGEADEN